METLQFQTIAVNKYLLQQHTLVFEKIPRKNGKIPKYNIISYKKKGKTLGKHLLPELNRSRRQTPEGRKF